mmetsp:Transcript_11457/g.26061  ORF Transcript_11457/g.26061 Transcript_11457/m.26061 type:complete len:231 (-) Transcript_11457:297-989(-)
MGEVDRSDACTGKGDRQRELCQIIAGREALQVRLQQLRDEVRLCEANLEALVLREERLMSEMVGEPNTDPDDPDDTDHGGVESIATTATPGSGPVFFELEADHMNDEGWSGSTPERPCTVALSPSSNERPLAAQGGEEYEDALDLGVAKCRLCGARFPLDAVTIENHARVCSRTSGAAMPLIGRCSGCGEQLPLTVAGVEAHRCLATAATMRWRREKQGAQRLGQKQPGQ